MENGQPVHVVDVLSEHDRELLDEFIEKHPDKFAAVPWQYDDDNLRPQRDEDGFEVRGSIGTGGSLRGLTRQQLHAKIWQKYHFNPHVNTSTRGLVGRITGNGFETVSEIQKIQEVIEETEYDYRNRLYDYWPKFVTRTFISGELQLCFTCHDDSFIEIDFVEPDVIQDSEVEHGIIFHPRKSRMPLVYCINDDENDIHEQVPSIYLARYPELYNVAKRQKGFKANLMRDSRPNRKAFRSLNGFNRFIVSWDLGLITSRSTSHLQTILEWLNHWENLKKYEIDHKKSSGAYVYVVRFTDVKSWITWMNLSDEQRSKTGIVSPKSPGGTMVIGPNMEVKIENTTLPRISEGDTDIMQMISSGLNEPADVTTGQAKGTFASVKASRGPMSDKVSDEKAYFERWMRWDFWGNVFFLKSKITASNPKVEDFPETFTVREATHFENKKPVMEDVKKKPEQCIEIMFPVSAIENIEGHATAFLGSKHGSMNDTAGIPHEELVRKMGFRGYPKMRLRKATEDEKYPPTILNVDQESYQERKEAEPKRQQQTPTPQ